MMLFHKYMIGSEFWKESSRLILEHMHQEACSQELGLRMSASESFVIAKHWNMPNGRADKWTVVESDNRTLQQEKWLH